MIGLGLIKKEIPKTDTIFDSFNQLSTVEAIELSTVEAIELSTVEAKASTISD